jgi:hypothetical protein
MPINRRTLMLGGPLMVLAGGRARPAGAAASPVVLELFTSQGCSSCPPADALLGELGGRDNVIALAWHVDYWNSLGWRDPFARREWTDRQRAYAQTLREEVYTPALVINGASMVVGSDRSAVARAMGRAGPLQVTVALHQGDGGLEAEIGTMPERMTLLLAVYDPERATDVSAGENGGRKLREYHVVREAVTQDAAPGRTMLPNVQSGQQAALLIQDAYRRIRGAAALPRPA